ncbi:hypothetical protein GDO81_029523 [Engystomops pustulosus]|uniref:Secreted protein n=1 Tax=Engystomops pustulosus TaxID=76066 RepID=A0AAV6YBY5_ENGPU|nr:hypothetical protein GDO81_029523 [Engystomops pustulosus]
MFVMQHVLHSNLLLLVSDSLCDCSLFPQVSLQAKEVKYILIQNVRNYNSQHPHSVHSLLGVVATQKLLGVNEVLVY